MGNFKNLYGCFLGLAVLEIRKNLKNFLFEEFMFSSFLSLRSSHRRCFVKKGVLRNFTKFTRKFLCQSLFFSKGAGVKPSFKKRLWHRFSCEFCEVSKNIFFTEHLRWLLLQFFNWTFNVRSIDFLCPGASNKSF